MRPPQVSDEAVVQAGEQLKSAGRHITGFALREKVGGGNSARLMKVWDEHVKNTSIASNAEPVADLPIELAERMETVGKSLLQQLAALASEVNDKAIKDAARRVNEIERKAAGEHEQLEREMVDANQTIDVLETNLEEAATTAAAHVLKIEAQTIELATLRERLAMASGIAEERDAALREVELARERAANLQGRVDVLTSQAEKREKQFLEATTAAKSKK